MPEIIAGYKPGFLFVYLARFDGSSSGVIMVVVVGFVVVEEGEEFVLSSPAWSPEPTHQNPDKDSDPERRYKK